MSFGDLVYNCDTRQEIAVHNRVGPRHAMSTTLAKYLQSLTFRIDGMDDLDTTFQLIDIKHQWPRPDEALNYPCASIIDTGGLKMDAHNFTPTPFEETVGLYDYMVGYTGYPPRTVLWKESGASCEFQVDFWASDKAMRQAIEAGIHAAFSPNEGRYGIVVEGPELYYSRKIRYSLMSTIYDDSENTSYPNERRLRCVVASDCDIVSLRLANLTATPVTCVLVEDTNDPEEEST